MPDNCVFKTNYEIQIADINYGGHVGNDRILTIAQEARMQYFRSLGYKNEVELEGNVGSIMADAAIEYKAESHYGEKVTIALGVKQLSKYGFDMYYEIKRLNDEKIIARIKTGILFMDYEKRKIAPVPSKIADEINHYL